MVYASRPHASFFNRLLDFAYQSGKKPGNWKAVSHISPGVTFYFFTTSAASPTSASASFHQSEAAFKIWLLAVCAFYQRVLAAVWLAARLLLLLHEWRPCPSVLSVSKCHGVYPKGLCQQAEDSSLFTEGPDFVPLSPKQTLQAHIVTFCMSSLADRRSFCPRI